MNFSVISAGAEGKFIRPLRGRMTGPTLCPGPKVGAVIDGDLTSDRNSLTDFPIHRASRWIVDCSGSASA